MIPEEPTYHPSPFHHLRPELWKKTKVMHIILMTCGTLLMIPVVYTMIGAAIYLFNFGSSIRPYLGDIMPGLISLMLSCCSGGLAWSALGLLFFKRSDARWQRACWAIVSVFGCITAPCAIGWWLYISEQIPTARADPGVIWLHLIFLFITAVALQSAVYGWIHSRRAGITLRTPPEVPHQAGI